MKKDKKWKMAMGINYRGYPVVGKVSNKILEKTNMSIQGPTWNFSSQMTDFKYLDNHPREASTDVE